MHCQKKGFWHLKYCFSCTIYYWRLLEIQFLHWSLWDRHMCSSLVLDPAHPTVFMVLWAAPAGDAWALLGVHVEVGCWAVPIWKVHLMYKKKYNWCIINKDILPCVNSTLCTSLQLPPTLWLLSYLALHNNVWNSHPQRLVVLKMILLWAVTHHYNERHGRNCKMQFLILHKLQH